MTPADPAILIVEDDESTLALEKRTLERSGHRVHTVGLVRDALEALSRESFQAVLLDYRLPDGEGWPVFEAAQQRVPPVPVIFVTGVGDERIAAEMIHRGVADYLIKGPEFWDRLPASLERVLRLDRAERTNARLAAIVEASDDAIGSIDMKGMILSWNGGAERLYGYSREEVEGRAGDVIVPRGLGREVAGLLERVHRGEAVRNFETQRVRKDGSLVDVSTTLSPIRDPAGHVIGATFVTRDITDRRTAEKNVRESEERHRALFDASPLPMWLYDRDSLRFLAVNDAAVRHYGYSRDELLSMSLEDIRPPEDIPKLHSDHRQEASGYHRAGIWRHVKKDGTVIQVDVHVTDVAIGGRVLRLALLHDVTEHLKLEEQFRQAQKMEAVGRLAGGVAHDFNNLLTVINGYTELLLDRFPDDPEKRTKTLGEIAKAGERAAGLTRQLLAFSRKQVVAPRSVDLSKIVSGIESLLRRLIGEDVELVVSLGQRVWNVSADPGQIEQVIMNLAVNARDAMPRGGRLTIETRNVELDDAYAREHASVKPGPYVLLAVGDTGTGMDEETKAHLFEPFFTTKEQGKGTGLGLATVYGIVRQFDGHVWVYSELGKGTTFKVYLPRGSRRPSSHPSLTRLPIARAGTETVLLVEDDASVRRLAAEVLRASGYTVLEAPLPTAAIAMAESASGPIHVLLTDIVMPEMSGPDLADAIQTRHPSIRPIFMSGYSSEAAVNQRLLEAGTAFLEKPFRPADLARKVREVLEGNAG